MKTRKGKYKPQNPEKYVGDSSNIIYRSGWERHFMVWCDQNDSVLKWSSEEKIIPYRSPLDNKIHRYYVDFWIRIKTKSGAIQEKLIEIKPFTQTQQPKKPSNRVKPKTQMKYLNEAKTFAVNQAKWKAAQEYCQTKDMEFMILTEYQLGIKNRCK